MLTTITNNNEIKITLAKITTASEIGIEIVLLAYNGVVIGDPPSLTGGGNGSGDGGGSLII